MRVSMHVWSAGCKSNYRSHASACLVQRGSKPAGKACRTLTSASRPGEDITSLLEPHFIAPQQHRHASHAVLTSSINLA